MTNLTTAPATQIYQVFIKASPEQIWDAITKPDLTERYFHGARIQNTAERHLSHGPDCSKAPRRPRRACRVPDRCSSSVD
jgi:hypothetical protein